VNRGVRAGIPALYAAAILIGFLINAKTGVIVAIGGAVVASALYTIIGRATSTPENARRPTGRRGRRAHSADSAMCLRASSAISARERAPSLARRDAR